MDKNTIKLVNAFSLSMVSNDDVPFIRMREISVEDFKNDLMFANVVSHISIPEIANVLSNVLDREIPVNRSAIYMSNNRLVIAKIYGGNLPENTKILPDGYKVRFVEVYLNKPNFHRMPESKALNLSRWPIEVIHPEEPTVMAVDWSNGETTILTISRAVTGRFYAYIESRTGLVRDCFMVNCEEQSWQDVIRMERDA